MLSVVRKTNLIRGLCSKGYDSRASLQHWALVSNFGWAESYQAGVLHIVRTLPSKGHVIDGLLSAAAKALQVPEQYGHAWPVDLGSCCLSHVCGDAMQVCNGYLPADSALSRLIFVVDFLTNNGFYIVLSNNLEVRFTSCIRT